jgi:hypothetical protein
MLSPLAFIFYLWSGSVGGNNRSGGLVCPSLVSEFCALGACFVLCVGEHILVVDGVDIGWLGTVDYIHT